MQANKQTWGVGAKSNHWILRVSILLVRFPEHWVKGKTTKTATIISQKEKSSYHHTMLSSHQQHSMNTTRMTTILSQQKHINTS